MGLELTAAIEHPWMHTATPSLRGGSARKPRMSTVWRVRDCIGLRRAFVIGHQQIPPINPLRYATVGREPARQGLAP